MAEINGQDGHEDWRMRIDEDVRGLGERMAGVETGMSSLGRSVDRLTHTFEASSERQVDLQKTRWPVVLGVLSIVTVVLSGFLSGYLRDLNRVEASVEAIREKRVSAEDPVQNAKLEDLQEEQIDIRAEEHRDMKRDSAIVERVRALERKVFHKPGMGIHGAETGHLHGATD